MKRYKLLFLTLIMLIAGVLIGWMMMEQQVDHEPDPTHVQADYIGVIEETNQGKLTVKTEDEESLLHVMLEQQTKINVHQMDQQVKLEDLQKGMEVAFWCQQPMLKIYPPRCHAEKVMIMNQEPTTQPLENNESKQVPTPPPVLQGDVTEIKGTKLTVVDQDQKGYVTIHEQTKIYLQTSEGLQSIKQAEIKEGMKVKVWYDGVMIMIYPMQVPADQLILEP